MQCSYWEVRARQGEGKVDLDATAVKNAVEGSW
jgi:hypothetical protein